MKPTNPTSPLVVVATSICLFLSIHGISQSLSADSLSYYRQVVNQPQSAKQLIHAYQFFEQHRHTALVNNDMGIVSHDNFQLARIHYKGGFYTESETLAIDALQLVDQLPEDAFSKGIRKSIYNHLGMLYREQQHKDKALELYHTTLRIAENTFDSVIVYNNRSNTYKDFEVYDQAKAELLKAYRLLPRVQDSLTHAMVLDNMGYLNQQLGDTTALSLYNKALQIRLHAGDTAKALSSYYNLSKYYRYIDKARAVTYALKGLSIAKTLNNPLYEKEALELLVEIDPSRYYMPYKTLSDSIADAQKLVQNKFALLKYDVSKSELQAEREKARRLQYQTIFFIVLAISILTIFLTRANAKKRRLLEVYTTETRISKKVHDEIANDVYRMMTNLQTATPTTEELLDDLEGIYIKTRDISKENTLIDMDQNFDIVLQDLLLAYQGSHTTIITHNSEKINWNKLSHTKKHSVYRVLQELMTNMKKHSKATNVLVSFSQKRSKIHITYKDNGVGSELHKHTGLQNAENRIKAIKGTITFDSEPQKGFQATLLI